MKKQLLSIFLLFTMVFSAIGVGNITVVAEADDTISSTEGFLDRIKKDFKMVWNDEFNEDELDTTKWQYDGDGINRNSEAQMYSNGPEDGNVYMEDGNVVLKAKKETVYSGSKADYSRDYSSGEISTHGKENWKYGYFEFRAKLPRGNNVFPAIWMMGYNYDKGTCDWPYSGEIDVMEGLGGDSDISPTGTWSTLHHTKYQTSGSGNHVASGAGTYETADKSSMSNEYHNFWIYWTDKVIVMGVDEGAMNVIDITKPEFSQSFRNFDHWILFDLAMAPYNKEIKERDTDDWRFFIDYVRVYQPESDEDYDNYNIIEAEDTITDNVVTTSYTLTSPKIISNSKVPDVASTFTDIDTGTYDVYAALQGKATESKGVYDTYINGQKTGSIDNDGGKSIAESKQVYLGTVDVQDDSPFEVRFKYASGKANNLLVDKYMFVKSDRTDGVAVNSENCQEFFDSVDVSNEEELGAAFSKIKPGGTIKLLNNISMTSQISIYRDFKLDFNGYTITVNGLKNCAFNLRNVVDVEFTNGKVICNGNNNGLFNQFVVANEYYNSTCKFNNIDVVINAKKMATDKAFFAEYYGSCNYTVSNCSFDFTSTTYDDANPLQLSAVSSITYNNVTVKGNGLLSPFKVKNGGSSSSPNKLVVENCIINNCNNVFASALELTKNIKITFANSTFNNIKALTNFDKNITFAKISDNNKMYNDNSDEISLESTLSGNLSIVCNHEFNDATCCEPATCKYCGKTQGESLGGHVAGEEVVVASDCVNKGTKTVKCTVCGEILSQKTMPIIDHNFEFVSQVEPSCAKEGYKLYKCKDCGILQYRSYTDDAMPARVDHTPDPLKEVIVNPTCTSGGYVQEYCTTCNKTYVKHYYRGSHQYVASHISGDCVHDSYTQYTCTVCNFSYKADIVAASGSHTPLEGSEQVVAATCGTEGYTEYTCSVCGEKYKTDIVAVTGIHTANTLLDKVVEPTCTQAGYTEHTCSICGKIYRDTEVAAKEHKASNDWTVTTEATCQHTGLRVKYCVDCNAIAQQEVIPKAEHTIVIDTGVPATCTSTGITEGSHCSVCGVIIGSQQVIPKATHNYIMKIVNPTCTKQGYTIHTCTECNNSYNDNYKNALGHKYKWVTTRKSTYFASGVKVYKCSTCGKILKTQSIDKLKLGKPIVRLKKGSKKITVSYKKVTGAKKYEILVKIKGKWKKYTTTKLSKTITGLKKSTRYYVKVQAVVTSGNKVAKSLYSKTVYIKTK